MPIPEIDAQVVEILTHMVIPDGFKERVEAAVRSRVENAAAIQRMEEITEIISRIDFRWDQGFISKEEYLEKRRQLDLEISALRPIDYDDLIEAADLVTNFKGYWEGCKHVKEVEVAQQQLLAKIVERMFVHENRVIALALYGDFGVILGKNETASYLVAEVIAENLLSNGEQFTYRSQFGDDGFRPLTSYKVIIVIKFCRRKQKPLPVLSPVILLCRQQIHIHPICFSGQPISRLIENAQ